ncbi:MAG: iron ABC transporter permease [Bacillota bacterium]|nr:iron ABC transporter permease [Bacillota bacterium]
MTKPERDKNKIRKPNRKLVLIVMVLILAVVFILANAIGTVFVPFPQIIRIILKHLGILRDTVFQYGQEAIIFMVRLPRVIVAMVVGAALATAGAVMQGMFRNPMADPGIIGISSGASLGAVTAILTGLSVRNIYYMPMFAIAGALGAALIIFILSSRGGKVPVLTLVLSGIAVSTFLGAITSVILTYINDYQVRAYLFWTLGGLSDRRWEHVNLATLPIIVCIAVLFIFARDLNVLQLGEEEAQAVGLNPSRTRKILLFFASVTAALAVCVSGAISFVGLIVPHIMRLIVGPDHRILLPASALGGAIFLIVCDLISRVVLLPREIGVGIVTSLIGAPYFLFLLIRARKDGGAVI